MATDVVRAYKVSCDAKDCNTTTGESWTETKEPHLMFAFRTFNGRVVLFDLCHDCRARMLRTGEIPELKPRDETVKFVEGA